MKFEEYKILIRKINHKIWMIDKEAYILKEKFGKKSKVYLDNRKGYRTLIKERNKVRIDGGWSKLRGNKDLKITDHALLRYMERVLNFDIKAILDQILTEDLIKEYKKVGSEMVTLYGVKYAIVDGVVATVMCNEGRGLGDKNGYNVRVKLNKVDIPT